MTTVSQTNIIQVEPEKNNPSSVIDVSPVRTIKFLMEFYTIVLNNKIYTYGFYTYRKLRAPKWVPVVSPRLNAALIKVDDTIGIRYINHHYRVAQKWHSFFCTP